MMFPQMLTIRSVHLSIKENIFFSIEQTLFVYSMLVSF